MNAVIDHIFILSDKNAIVADQLVKQGITEGTSNVHTGQGTTNRRFYFQNAMIEFLWVHDEEEADSPQTRPTYLLPRWQGRQGQASPFGICFCTTSPDVNTPLFPSWDYHPDYLPPDLSIQISNSVHHLTEPFLFFVSGVTSADPSVIHPCGIKNLTSVTVISPHKRESDAMKAIQHLVSFVHGDRHGLTLTFDDHQQGQVIDLQPDAPLVIRY